MRSQLVPALALALVPSVVSAQPCSYNTWDAPAPVPLYSGTVYDAVEWDPDGPGWMPRVVVTTGYMLVGGSYREAVGYWDGSAWQVLGASEVRSPRAVAVLNGHLIASGEYRSTDGAFRPGVARWSGAAWEPLGAASNEWVQVLYVTPTGELIAGGRFTSIGGIAANRIARWDGTDWAPLGGGITSTYFAPISDMISLPTGDLVVCGVFSGTGDGPAEGIARWDGTRWWAMGDTRYAGFRSLALLPGGDLLAGGGHGEADGVRFEALARWNGSVWSPITSGFRWMVGAIAVLPDGSIIAADGNLSYSDLPDRVARWNGNSWVPLHPPQYGDFRGLRTRADGDVLFWGTFIAPGGINAHGLARLHEDHWRAITPGIMRPGAICLDLQGLPVIAGEACPGCSASAVVRFDGTDSTPLGAFNNKVFAVATAPNGELIAGGSFTAVGQVQASRVARLTPAGWLPMGSGFGPDSFNQLPEVFALLSLPDGDLMTAGKFQRSGSGFVSNIARWNGAEWSQVGSGLLGPVYALGLAPNGDVIAGGRFAQAGSANIARWDGAHWQPMLPGLLGESVRAVHVARDGRLYAGGSLDGGHVYERVGGAWVPLGPGFNGRVLALGEDSRGHLIAGGEFTVCGDQPINRGARWDGTQWVQLAFGFNDAVTEIALMPDGDLAVAGPFTSDGYQPAGGYARLRTPSSDFNGDGDHGTEQDIEAFFACLAGYCCATCWSGDFNGDGDWGTDSDIEAFFRVLAGQPC
jgi:trimeric autotransporter adhesin